MPRRSWDDRWPPFPASAPLPADGIKHSKQRGAMAGSWWSQRFVAVLESYGLGGRMQRGRRYARIGQVLSLDVQPGTLTAKVQGSRRAPYAVTIKTNAPTAAQRRAIDRALHARVGFVARLLAGDMPPDLEAVFASASIPLFPRTWSDLRTRCSCPDLADPCKHIAAVLYLFADRLDDDPWTLLAWRGWSRDALLEPLRARATSATSGPTERVAPWWPFGGGAEPNAVEKATVPEPVPGDPVDAVLARLPALDPLAGGTTTTARLHAAYDAMTRALDTAADAGSERGHDDRR
jgi:uncharacterized Zn finger protein